MNADASSSAGNAALVVSGTGGMVAAINEYAVVIGLALSALSIVIGLIFHIRADRWRTKSAAQSKEEMKREILNELELKK